MNTAKLARATFVLDRETRDELAFISDRLGVSQSELVRDVLAEPVAMMAKWVRAVPDAPTADDAMRLQDAAQGDLVDFIERRAHATHRAKKP